MQRDPTEILDYIRLLAENEIQDLALMDVDGWTCLHRVAGIGKADEVKELLLVGADPTALSKPLGWNALQHAVFYNNEATYFALQPSYGSTLVSMSDERGWTLVHLAATAGNATIIEDLLTSGADPYARSDPSGSEYMDSTLFQKSCSPTDVAANESDDHLKLYMQVVDEYERKNGVAVRFREVGEASDFFWDASE